MALINIAGTVNDSIVDGEGYRFTIFTQGCPHHCAGCHNPHTHDFAGGKKVDTDSLFTTICANKLLSGVTFSGGEPFCQPAPLVELGLKLKQKYLDIWIYTGYTLEALQALHSKDIDALLTLGDVLVDGKFILARRDLTLAFRGSSNQRLIDLNKTRTTGHVVLKKLDSW